MLKIIIKNKIILGYEVNAIGVILGEEKSRIGADNIGQCYLKKFEF